MSLNKLEPVSLNLPKHVIKNSNTDPSNRTSLLKTWNGVSWVPVPKRPKRVRNKKRLDLAISLKILEKILFTSYRLIQLQINEIRHKLRFDLFCN